MVADDLAMTTASQKLRRKIRVPLMVLTFILARVGQPRPSFFTNDTAAEVDDEEAMFHSESYFPALIVIGENTET